MTKERKKIDKVCCFCGNNFLGGSAQSKVCKSSECQKFYKEERKIKKREGQKRLAKDFVCKFCHQVFRRYKEKGGFCSQSCASKFHIQLGTYDTWRLRTNEKTGSYKKCLMCENEFYFTKKNEEQKCCSVKCKGKYLSFLFEGEKSVLFGTKLTEEQKAKKKKTMLDRYGVETGWALAKHTTPSKPQVALFECLKVSFPNGKWEIEKTIIFQTKHFYADIVSNEHNLIIEFNGDYIHSNPLIYDPDFYNEFKGMCACEIWEKDQKRIEMLKKAGYNVLVIWEMDVRENKHLEIIGKEIKRIEENA